MTGFANFSALAHGCIEGIDYRIRCRDGTSGILVMAPHGGKIEPGTGHIAASMAGRHHAFYEFCGLRKNGNRRLHITSHLFDEPRALALAHQANVVVTIHGCRDKTPAVYIGGRHDRLRQRLGRALTAAGFKVGRHPNLPGLHPSNICNRGRCGMGVQIEISAGLRRRMFVQDPRRKEATGTEVFSAFTAAAGNTIAVGIGTED